MRTFLFTDLEGSTERWLQDEQAMAAALDRHDAILRSVAEAAEGAVLKHTGDGMVLVFQDPLRAVEAATAAQRGLRADPDGDRLLRARMGLHTGPCTERDGDYFGPTLNRTARIMGAAHGGQVLVSAAAASLVGDRVELLDLGPHRLRDLLEPERLHQVVVDDAGAYPPVRSLDAFDHNLPPQRTRLVGRDADVGTVRDLLAASRLVTLAGVGGVGKTRLALEVAARELDARDGVVFVDLAPVADPDLVPTALASAAGMPPSEAGADLAPLVRLFGSRSMLVVLDNCEHLLDACGDLAELLLDECAATAILTTSREPLGVEAERVWRVPSLTDPAAAVELFVDRATAAGVQLPLDARTEATIADICGHLDGIPLAIELAAARTPHLSLDDIAARLEERFRFLTGGRRRSRQRHQTLQAALDWSHDLLDDAERTVLRRAAVFTGGFTLDALASVVCEDLPGRRPLLDVLASLVDRSLVVAGPVDGDAARYTMLETVRLYGLDRLTEAGEAAELRHRHVAWVRGWVGSPTSISILVPPTAERRVERDNVVAALDWLADCGDLHGLGRLAADAQSRLGDALWVDDGWRYFGRADVEAALEGRDLARYLVGGAATANAVGDFRRQAEIAERARAAEDGSPEWRNATLLLANALAVFEPSRSAALYDELLSTLPAGDAEARAFALARSADPALMTEDLEEGARLLDESERVGGLADLDLGFPHLLLGRLDRVRDAAASLRVQHLRPMLGYRAPLLEGLLAAVEGRSDDAAAALIEAAHHIERFPIRLVDHDVLNGFAVLAHHEGDHRRAAALLAVVATGPVWARSPGVYALHMHYRRLVRATLDREEIRRIRGEVLGTSVPAALAEEVARRS